LYFVADAAQQRNRSTMQHEERDEHDGEARLQGTLGGSGCTGLVGDAIDAGLRGRLPGREDTEREAVERYSGCRGTTNGFWADAEWIWCRDRKYRPVESINESLADGSANLLGYSSYEGRHIILPLIAKTKNRVGRLRGYGNALVSEQAKAFIQAYMEVRDE
jgi:DNA (cytosine-5)-methyltransferase 1